MKIDNIIMQEICDEEKAKDKRYSCALIRSDGKRKLTYDRNFYIGEALWSRIENARKYFD